jgi:mannobiose 2-epimerase
MTLVHEFRDYLEFWSKHMIRVEQDKLYPEISIDNVPNSAALRGSMYLARILYGASKACGTMQTKKYLPLADKALRELAEFRNPKGGYYWARTNNKEWVHDAENVCMAQAFVLYGLVEYAFMNPSPEVEELIKEQFNFIQSVLREEGGTAYLDGFDAKWEKSDQMTRSFGTHFHVLEALVKYKQYKEVPGLKETIVKLIRLVIDKFIDPDHFDCIHRFGESWELMPNEIWAGHNAECSWVLCEAALETGHEELIEETRNLAILMMDRVITFGLDKNKGGYFNVLYHEGSRDKSKGWWQQAEAVLGLLNAYEITGQNRYKKLALEQIFFIRDKFICPEGEWYTEVNNDGKPVTGLPKVSFWKSMYHTVRYYDYVMNRLDP